MRIEQIVYSPGSTGFYFDDQKAIKAGAVQDGFFYKGHTETKGFSSIRMGGESVSVQMITEQGHVGAGDCAAVQYSGTGGRDPLFLADGYMTFMTETLTPLIQQKDFTTFREAAQWIDTLETDGKRLHTAIRYGVSQAFLNAFAAEEGITGAEVICREYGLQLPTQPIPLFGQTGDDRYTGVDKMILKGVDVLPHGLINNIDTKLGRDGELLREYISWMNTRIHTFRASEDYKPALHIDVYGTPGMLWNNDTEKIASYLASLQEAAGDLELSIEGPVDRGEREAQIEGLGAITRRLEELGSPVRIVADEWCNTWDDIKAFTDARCCHMVQIKTPDLGSIHNIIQSNIYCKEHNMGAYQGGTCNETDISAKTCVQVALASQPERLLVKPGMGFDEGLTIVGNEMNRTLALINWRKNR